MLFNSRDWITIARSFDFRVKYRIKKQYKSSETACVYVYTRARTHTHTHTHTHTLRARNFDKITHKS